MIRNALSEVKLTHTRAFRIAASLILVALCAYLGYSAPRFGFLSFTGYELVIELLFLGILFLVFLRHIEVGVIALVLTAFFIRLGLATGTASRVPASLVLAFVVFAVWLVHMLAQKRISLYPSSANLPLLLFILVAALSMPWSWLFWRPDLFLWRATQTSGARFELVQTAALSVMIMLPVVFFIALNTIREVKWYRYLFIAVAIIGLPELLQRQFNIYPRIGVLSLSGPGLYQIWLIGLIYGQVLFNDQLSKWLKVFFVALIVGWVYWAFVGKLTWISGWGPVAVTILAVTWMKSKRLAIVLAFLAIIPFLLHPDYYYNRIIVVSQQEDFNRFWLWRTIVFDLTLARADALLGTGPAGYAPYFQTYYPGQGMSAHNNYVDIIAQTGLLGFACFTWFLFAVVKTGGNQSKQLTDPFLLGFNNGVLGSFVGMLSAMLLNDWFMPFAYNSTISAFDWNVYAWILLGAMVGLERFVPSAAKKLLPLTAPTAAVSVPPQVSVSSG